MLSSVLDNIHSLHFSSFLTRLFAVFAFPLLPFLITTDSVTYTVTKSPFPPFWSCLLPEVRCSSFTNFEVKTFCLNLAPRTESGWVGLLVMQYFGIPWAPLVVISVP